MPGWIDPNIGYMLLMLSLPVSLAAVLIPGTGVLELAVLVLLILTALQIVNQPVNLWALVVMLLSIVPLVVTLRRKGDERLLAIGIALLLSGAAWLFHDNGWLPAVHPLVLLMVSAAIGWLLWFFAHHSLQTLAIPLAMNVDGIVGKIGETRTTVHESGLVYVRGELWSARSSREIPPKQQVRIVRREGLSLIVEPIQDGELPS